MNEVNRIKINEFLRKKNWILLENTNGEEPIYEYQNSFCSIKIQHLESKSVLLYLFEENVIKSLVQIEYKENIFRLLELISFYGEKMSSNYYAEQINKIVSEFPQTYFSSNGKLVLLKVGGEEHINSLFE